MTDGWIGCEPTYQASHSEFTPFRHLQFFLAGSIGTTCLMNSTANLVSFPLTAPG